MKRIIFYMFLPISIGLCGQANITLDKPHTTGGVKIACQSVSLQSGFSFKATDTMNLTLQVDPSACDPYAGIASSASSNQNYIQIKTYTVNDASRYIESNQYFDGLGRSVQTVQRGITSSTADLAIYQEYDPIGRQNNTWLSVPLSSNNGAFADLTQVKNNVNAAYPNETAPYTKPIYESAPSGRIKEQYGPGAAWHTEGKAVKIAYLTNSYSGTLACMQFTAPDHNSLRRTGIYATNSLFVTQTTNEDGQISYTFTDKQEKVILQRIMDGEVAHDTYYVYDVIGNLRYVLPPLASDVFTAGTTYATWYDDDTTLKNYGYIYKYDGRKLCIQKKLPGCEPVDMKYDKADRLIFSQDGNQKDNNEWLFCVYDALGRPSVTGIWGAATVPAIDNITVKASYSGATTFGGYTVNLTLPAVVNLTTVNYYDSYAFVNTLTVAEKEKMVMTTLTGYDNAFPNNTTPNAKGLLTGTRIYQLEDPSKYSVSVSYYDHRGRPVQTHASNHTGGFEDEYIAYNFTGQATQRKHIHSATGKNTQTEVYAYVYDHAGRLLKTTHQLTDGTIVKPQVTLAENTYDELGRLKTNKKNNQANLTTTYAYNVRSWTKSISSPLFNQTLYYNDKVTAHTYSDYQPSYSGNISGMEWQLQGEAKRSYRFKYDNLSRLTGAAYNGIVSGGMYNTAYTYDKHGNMTTLARRGKKTLAADNNEMTDQLTMSYAGNQLIKADDAIDNFSLAESADFKDYSKVATEYTYNKNGALSKDLNKGVSAIEYNSLNLPRQMDIKSPVGEGRNKYTYSAGGEKLRVEQKWNPNYLTTPVIGSGITESALTKTETTDYVGNIIYESHSDGTSKIRILVDGGYIENNVYYFYQNDHLGNNRVVANASGVVTQKTHYYPFGTAFAESTNSDNQPYKYNGKELDKMHGLNLYDYSARYYESAIGRFTSIDPKAEKYYSWSPYHYAANNPIRIIDPNGEDWRDFLNGFVDGVKGKVSSIKQFVTDPKGTMVSIAQDYKDRGMSPTQIAGDMALNAYVGFVDMNTGNALSTGIAINKDIQNGSGGYETGSLMGGQTVDGAIALGTVKAGQGVSKVASNIGSPISKAGNATKTISPNVEKVVNAIKSVESSGGSVKLNALKPSQEINMTIGKGAEKINLRIETHVVDTKFGGNGASPQRHMNVDYYKNARRKTNDHTILD